MAKLLGCLFFLAIQYAYGDKKVPTPAEVLTAYGVELTVPSLVNALSSTQPMVRQNAAVLLGNRKVRAAVPELRKLLTDEFVYARLAAAGALVSLGDPTGEAALVKGLEGEDSPAVIYAASTLTELGNASGYEVVARISSDSSQVMDRLQAVRALPKFLQFRDKEGSVVGAVAKAMLADPDQRIRLAAAGELRNLKRDDVKQAFEEALKSADSVIRELAQEYLGRNR